MRGSTEDDAVSDADSAGLDLESARNQLRLANGDRVPYGHFVSAAASRVGDGVAAAQRNPAFHRDCPAAAATQPVVASAVGPAGAWGRDGALGRR